MTYGVLVVDDSAFMRKSITQIIENNPKFRVVGVARNGTEVLEKVRRLKPDLVTMDVEMPQMDGLATLEVLMREQPIPVVMVSSLTQSSTRTTIRALQLGAVDCVHKDQLLSKEKDHSRDFHEFYARLEAAAVSKVSTRKAAITTLKLPERKSVPTKSVEPKSVELRSVESVARTMLSGPIDLIVIGCSTGGPAALQSILPNLPANLPVPVIVIQHMPVGFTKSLAERFNHACKVPVKEAEDGELLQRGHVYIAPAGSQTLLRRHGSDTRVELTSRTTVDTRFHPSVDVTLLSVAPLYRDKLLTVILTGMGSDGTLGCKDVKHYDGKVLVQSEETCVVYGMPKSVYEAGYADRQLPLDHIANFIEEMLNL